MGGGIGIAPAMSMVNTIADTGDKRPVYVFYGDPALCSIHCGLLFSPDAL